MPRASHRSGEKSVGLRVVNKSFLFRIPSQFPLKKNRDMTQVTDARRPVCDLGGANCLVAILDTFHKIPLMVVAAV